MNMYCKIKRPDNSKENINQGELVVIQEKYVEKLKKE